MRASSQDKLLARLEKRLGLRLKDRALLEQALTHRSVQGETHNGEAPPTNERMEFLGDAVLGLVVGRHLYDKFPSYTEGDLTRMKAAAVSEPTLSLVAKKLGLGKYVRLSKGEDASGGRERASITADTLEAVIGAVFIAHGLKDAEALILKLLAGQLRTIQRQQHEKDYKTLLQELLQARHKTLPTYRLAEATGPDHDRTFTIEARFGRKVLGKGTGKSKKEAQQAAAKEALKRLEKAGEAPG